jgi:hypothetical protein
MQHSVPVIQDHLNEENNKISEIKNSVQVGDRVFVTADGIEYTEHYVAMIKDEEIILVRMTPRYQEQNYAVIRYENIEKIGLVRNDNLGVLVSLSLIILYLIA